MAIELAEDDAAISFQTGRIYSKDGQRIAATLLSDGSIAFYDIDRGIKGVVPGHAVASHQDKLTKDAVMWHYDRPETYQYWVHVAMADDTVWTALRAIASTVPSLNL